MVDLSNIDLLTLFAVLAGIVMNDRRLTKLEAACRRIHNHLFPGEDVNLG